MLSSSDFRWHARLKAAGNHFFISVLVVLAAAFLVFLVWYPYPYREISGGWELFLLVAAIDVVMGPLMTLAVFNLKKSMKELRTDLVIIGLLQLAALAYGLFTVSIARPVHLVFEIDRFRVVHAIDVPEKLLAASLLSYRQLPLTGPTLLSVREFKDSNESFDATMAALQGINLGARPDLWQDYEKAKSQVLAHSRPLADLRARFPNEILGIDQALKAQGTSRLAEGAIGYVPLLGRGSVSWTVLIDAHTAEILAFVPVDSF